MRVTDRSAHFGLTDEAGVSLVRVVSGEARDLDRDLLAQHSVIGRKDCGCAALAEHTLNGQIRAELVSDLKKSSGLSALPVVGDRFHDRDTRIPCADPVVPALMRLGATHRSRVVAHGARLCAVGAVIG